MSERRYPPSPYPPRSEATRLYRDGWDLGWRHMGSIGISRSREYYEGMTPGPAKHGYADGVLAWADREVKSLEAERTARATDAAARRARDSELAREEPPY